MNSYSAVIPTLNRNKDLKIAVDSILIQTIKPVELIIIDQSDNDETEKLVEKYSRDNKEINFIYKKIKGKSLTRARNTGIKLARGDIISFFDDDIELYPDYFKEIDKIFQEKKAIIVGGNVVNQNIKNKLSIIKLLKKIFFQSIRKQNIFIVQKSFNPVIGHPLSRTVKSQWTTGAAMSVKKCFAEKYKFDESLIKYALAEDIDFSYRIFKEYPQKVFISHRAKLNHYHSPSGRLPSRELIFMNAVHKRYLFEKNISKSLKSYYQFYISRIGRIFLQFLLSLKKMDKKYLIVVSNMIKAEIFVRKNIKNIKNLNLEFFHVYLDKINKKRIL